jgi:hypothetical protein
VGHLHSLSSWPGSSRPSTSVFSKVKKVKKDLDARHKAGHDERWNEFDFQQKGGTGFPVPP